MRSKNKKESNFFVTITHQQIKDRMVTILATNFIAYGNDLFKASIFS